LPKPRALAHLEDFSRFSRACRRGRAGRAELEAIRSRYSGEFSVNALPSLTQVPCVTLAFRGLPDSEGRLLGRVPAFVLGGAPRPLLRDGGGGAGGEYAFRYRSRSISFNTIPLGESWAEMLVLAREFHDRFRIPRAWRTPPEPAQFAALYRVLEARGEEALEPDSLEALYEGEAVHFRNISAMRRGGSAGRRAATA